MDLPILGTIDLTPTGVFLFLAAVIAVGYFGWQIFGTARPGRDAAKSADAPRDDAGDGASDEARDETVNGDKDEPTTR